MAVFDVTQHVINNAGGLIAGNTAVDAAALETMQDTLEAMEIGPLFALFLQCMVVQFTIKALSVVIFVIVYSGQVCKAESPSLSDEQLLCRPDPSGTGRNGGKSHCLR